MNLNRDAATIAAAAAEEIRSLNHRTFDVDAFDQPSDIYRTVSALTQIMQGLPQAIEQTWRQLRAMQESDAIRTDDGGDLNERIDETRLALSEARRLTATGSGLLGEAARHLSHLGGKW